MLRLRTILGPDETLLVLEGRLAGWVDELERCWATLRDEKHGGPIRLDLDGITFVSAAGKARVRLLDFHRAQETIEEAIVRLNKSRTISRCSMITGYET